MFNTLKDLFTAIARLTASINKSADIFDAANGELEKRIGVEDEQPVLTNGRRKIAVEK